MHPENVNPKNFNVDRIIYNENGFSVAIGEWQDDETIRFAMRWNGNDDSEDVGYPKVFNNPMWFQLPENVSGIIAAIIQNCDGVEPSASAGL